MVNASDQVPESIGTVTASVHVSKTEDQFHLNLTTESMFSNDTTTATGKLYIVLNLFNSIYSFIHTERDFKPKMQKIDVPANHSGGIVQMVHLTEVINDRKIELNETFVLKGELSVGDGCFIDEAECASELHKIITIIDDEIDRK